MNRLVSLVEYVPRRGIALSVEERDALLATVSGLTARPEPGSTNTYTLTNGSTVGVVRIGDLAVELKPKIGAAAVLFLLSYELDQRAWRSSDAQLAADATLTEAVAALFVRVVSDVVRFGLLHDYQRRDDSLSTIRGRIRIADQIRMRRGIPLPTEVTFDEYTPDIFENRILRTAIDWLRRQRLRSGPTADSLRRLQATFAEISPLASNIVNLSDPTWTRLNERYRPAVELARTILANTGLEAMVGVREANALLVDMNRVFERFVRVALREELGLQPADFPPPNKIPRRSLDIDRNIPLQPDLTWWRQGECLLVADCKYKRPRGTVANADVYQMLAYLTEFQLDEGWLIYASGEVRETNLVIRNAAKTVHVRTINTASPPHLLLSEVHQLATELRRSVVGRPTCGQREIVGSTRARVLPIVGPR